MLGLKYLPYIDRVHGVSGPLQELMTRVRERGSLRRQPSAAGRVVGVEHLTWTVGGQSHCCNYSDSDYCCYYYCYCWVRGPEARI
jgi:hypothetical protein